MFAPAKTKYIAINYAYKQQFYEQYNYISYIVFLFK